VQTRDYRQLNAAFRELKLPDDYDLIIAIADGGLIPAAMINQRLKLPLKIIKINYRDDNKIPIYDEPRIYDIPQGIADKKILLVDDVSRSGATFEAAKKAFSSASRTDTLVVNGVADYSIYNEECFKFPWLID